MSITVNFKEVEYREGESINRLLKRMRYIYPMVIVKLNGEVIPKSKYIETKVPDGAVVEVLHIESGG